MNQFAAIARSIKAIDEEADSLNEAMKAGADVNYLSLNNFKIDLQKLQQSFQTLVLTRKADASPIRPE